MKSVALPRAKLFAQCLKTSLLAVTTAFAVISTASAQSNITIIQVSDLHGNMLPHAGVIESYDGEDRYVTQGGGIAKVGTVVKQIRAANPNSLTLGVGDSIHGSAEVLFTMGDAIMPAFNALGLDAYTPGNWEFAYGPAVFRHRFVELCKNNSAWQNPPQVNPQCPPLPPNVRVMVDSDGIPGVTAANFPTLANNLYNGGPYPPAAPFWGKRPLAPYKVFDVDGVKIAVIGITSSIVPQQPPVFSRTFDFTQGVEELPGDIAAAKAEGAEIIVVMSELALPQNVQIGREFAEVDIILSAHSHEVTLGAILADADGYEVIAPGVELTPEQLDKVRKDGTIIVEAGEDLYVGKLDIDVTGGKLKNFYWEAIPVDDSVAEDPEIAALVHDQEKYFIDGPDFKTHTFLPAAYCGPFSQSNPCSADEDGVVRRGLRLTDPLDVVIGETDVLLHRHDALEGIMNNFIADAFYDTLAAAAKGARAEWANLDVLSMTNGFRFDTVILPAHLVPDGATYLDGRQPGEVTLRDLWSYFPVAAAMVAADYNGYVIEQNLDGILANVFHRNPYVQRGGWYLGLSNNIRQRVDVVRRPLSTSGWRIVDTKVNGKLIDHSKRYIIASCYGHTFALGRSCRSEGGANTLFFTLEDGDDYSSALGFVEPLAVEGLIDNKTPGSPIRRAAPDNYLHPVHALRRYLEQIGIITDANSGVGRVLHVNSREVDPLTKTYKLDPIENHHDHDAPAIVQTIEGEGPLFLERGVIPQ